MRKQIDDMSNTYLLIMSLILILILVMGVRIINIYYMSDLEKSMNSHLIKLESLFENYKEAGESLGDFNDAYIDSELSERAAGIIELIKAYDTFESIIGENKNYFKTTDTSVLQVLKEKDIEAYVSFNYKMQLPEVSGEMEHIYFSTLMDGAPWRMLIEQIPNTDAVIIIGQKVSTTSEFKQKQKEFIFNATVKHFERETFDATILMIDETDKILYCSEHKEFDEHMNYVDHTTGTRLLDRVRAVGEGAFHYELLVDGHHKDYTAYVKKNNLSGLYIVMSKENMGFVDCLHKDAKMYLNFLIGALITLFGWTTLRIMRGLKQKRGAQAA